MASLSEVIAHDLVRPVYQPLVDLYSGEILGYEALARGPEGDLERPDQLFASARREDRLADLDRVCRRQAVRGAMAAGMPSASTLFVNVEPETIGSAPQAGDTSIPDGMRVVAEITERALTSRPADLLHMIERVRSRGIGIALDDVGADRRSLALMPFLRPDVIKLDLSLVQGEPSKLVAGVHNAVSAHAERTGAVVVAEGIENEEHLERARAMGATVGQGWHFGRPAPLPARFSVPGSSVPTLGHEHAMDHVTPYELMNDGRPQRRGTKRLLLEISRELERQAEVLGESAVLISTFQEARHFTPKQAEFYSRLSNELAFVGALGCGMSTSPAEGVRGSDLAADDPLVNEWDIVVVGPHFAAAFTARDLGDTGVADMDRRFDFQLTHDRERSLRAARNLMARIAPVGAGELAGAAV